jgi:hypothetical protein
MAAHDKFFIKILLTVERGGRIIFGVMDKSA